MSIKYRAVKNHDHDPVIIEIYYPKLTETEEYLRPGLLLEVGSRSLKAPFTVGFHTFVAGHYAGEKFADQPIAVPAVNPKRTFLERYSFCTKNFNGRKKKYGLTD